MQLQYRRTIVPVPCAGHPVTRICPAAFKSHKSAKVSRESRRKSVQLQTAAVAAPASVVPATKFSDEKTLNIVFVSAEVTPWSKTGGLADVCGSLPVELA